MKTINRYLFILLIIFGAGCEDFLEETPIDQETAELFFTKESDAIDAVTAAYGALTTNNDQGLYSRTMVIIEVLSDNCWSAADDPIQISNFIIDPETGIVSGYYRDLYQGINKANLAIHNIPGIVDMDEILKERLIGEALFLRAYFNFLLTLLYGDVPLVLESTDNPNGFAPAKSPASDIYNQIVADLKSAETKLPLASEYTISEFGRATSGAAKGLLAKVYLFGADELNKPEWYALAEQKAEEVIASNEYALVDTDNPFEDYKSLFTIEGEINNEIMFCVNHFAADATAWGESRATNIIIAASPRQTKGTIWGWGWNYIYKEVGDPSYWEEGDARRQVTVWSNGDDMAPVNPDETFDMSLQNRTIVRPDHYGLRKWAWTHEPGVDRNPSSPYNIPVLRYADLLLIHTEAALKNNSLDQQAIDSYNRVRDRAGLAPVSAITVDDVLKQRQLELLGEMHRWYDLMRTRTAEKEFAKITSVNDKDGFTPAKHYKFPIPQQAIDKNPALEQNPAW